MPPFTGAWRPGSDADHIDRLDAYQHDTTNADGKTEAETVSEIAGGVAAPGPLNLRMYVGPKSIDGLKAVRPPLNSLVQSRTMGA